MQVKLLCLVLAAFALQCGARDIPNVSQVNEQELARGLISGIQKAIELLFEAVVDAIKDTVGRLELLLNVVIRLGQTVIEATAKSLEIMVEGIISGLTSLIENASDLGVDVSECVGENLEEIKKIPKKMLKESVQCVDKQVQEAKDIVYGAITDIENTLDEVVSLGKELLGCGINPICLTRVSAKVAIAGVKIPLRITRKVAQVTSFVATIQSKLTYCETVVLAKATKDAIFIRNDVSKCIDEKMNEASFRM